MSHPTGPEFTSPVAGAPEADHTLAPSIPASAAGAAPPVDSGLPTASDTAVTDGQDSPPPRRLVRLGLGVGVGLAGAVTFFLVLHAIGARSVHGGSEAPSKNARDGESGSAIPVNIITPHRKTLVRTLEQPGSIKPMAEVELYARAPGYLKWIACDLGPEQAADIFGRHMSSLAAPMGATSACQLAIAAELAYWRSPEKDYGSVVHEGEPLLIIDAPELLQDISHKEAIWQQRAAELEAARSALDTFQASIQAVEAQKKQAEADIRRAASDRSYFAQQLARRQEMVKRQSIAPEMAEETSHQVDSAQAAWESSNAKLQAVQAELGVVASKLATAKADVHVKEAQVHVAAEDLHRAAIQEAYSRLNAPFDGIITYRDVDKGDFIQNSTSGQTRRLMTLAAIDKVKMVLQVPEREVVWVQPGAEAVVHVDARTRWEIKGRVSRIAHALDSQSRTMRVEIDLANPDYALKPGMYGQVKLTLQAIKDTQVLPATAVYSRGGENYIIQVSDGVARRQRVRITFDDGHEVAVVRIEGSKEVPLTGSEELVVSNKGELRDGQRVRTSSPSHP